MHWLENAKRLLLEHMNVLLFFFIAVKFDTDCQHVCSIWLCRLCACACWLLMVDLHITGRLLIGMGQKLKPVELCCYTPAHKHSKELMWSMMHNNNSRARWGPVVFLIYQHEG